MYIRECYNHMIKGIHHFYSLRGRVHSTAVYIVRLLRVRYQRILI